MQNDYIVKLFNNFMFKEIRLNEYTECKIGIDKDCNIRFYKENFPENFEIIFLNEKNNWTVICSENLYIDIGNVQKPITKNLVHGDLFSFKYRDSNNLLFRMEFLIDFDSEKKDYSRIIDLSSTNILSIGNNSSSNIILKSRYIKNEFIELYNNKTYLTLNIKNTTYGVLHNNTRAVSGEQIANYDFFSIADYSFYYKNGCIYTDKKAIVNSIPYRDENDRNSYPKFNRNTRIKKHIGEEKIEILDPPEKPQKQKNSLLTRLLPSLVMIIFGVAMYKTSPFMLVSSGLGIITAVLGIIENKREYKTNSVDREKKYIQYIENKKKEIEKTRESEAITLNEIYLDISNELKNLSVFSSELFDRTAEDDDFMAVRFGTGSKSALIPIEYKKQEKLDDNDNLQSIPEKLCEDYKLVHNAPIYCDFKECSAIGITGDEQYRYELFKTIIVDICSRQYPSDISLFFVVTNENKDKIHWLRMLPSVFNKVTNSRNIVYDDDSKNFIFEYLYKEFTLREQTKKFDKRIVVFLFDEYGFMNHPISKFINNGKNIGVTFVFFGESKNFIPQGCDFLINISDNQKAILINTADNSQSLNFKYKSISNSQASAIANFLAPVYTEEVSLESSLTKNISLFKLFNIIAVDDLDIEKRWKNSVVYESLTAPIGVSKSGIISLDLHDKAHGPHGLVAGTTGSGKSEILQTYILSMATLYHPYEVGFVIIDFKGGGMVNQFKSLPHLMGAITNIDGKEIDRSLKSIKAELQKRQRYFAEADVNHIDKYIKKYKNGEVGEPLPHLILIVDEFAELKAEQPEFMKELISAARIGRSLGVHLILATQKPSGQVNEQIWSNSRFKLCLKVQDQQDSNEVLKSPLAAEIKEPGRAYLQVGNNEIFELFQSAYSGAPEKADNNNVKEYKICEIDDAGRKKVVFEQKRKKADGETFTQLDAVVKYISEYCNKSNIYKLPDICLPSLKNVINFPVKDKLFPKDYSVTTEIGIYDDPDNQYQGTFVIDLANQNVMIIGSAQSGKTNILQNMIRSIASKYSPDEVSIYIIDFASMILKNFESLNHVGGVVTPSEDEKLKNLIKLLFTEIETRREKLMSVGVSSFSAYKEAGMTDLPQIILMIDNLTALKELYFEDDDDLLRLCREGLSVGITIIIANSQTTGIGYKYLANFSSKIALFCNDSSEYNSLFDHCREKIDDIHGRCIVEIDKEHYECQAYLAFEGEREIERVKEIKSFISLVNSGNTSVAKMIPVIPKLLTEDYVESALIGYMNKDFSLVIGMDYASVSPFVLQLNNMPAPLTVTGKEGSGRHNFFKYTVNALNNIYPESTEVYIIDSMAKKLSELNDLENVKSYSFLAEDSKEIVTNIEAKLANRYHLVASGDDNVLDDSKLIVLIINNRDAIEFISEDMNLSELYKNIIGKYKKMNVCVLFGDYENTTVTYASPNLIKAIRDAKHFLFFDELTNMKIVDIPIPIMRKFKKSDKTDDAHYINENEIVRIKTVRS